MGQTKAKIITSVQNNKKHIQQDMTKVGIITMHRVKNCGSALQAYATQYIVEKLGYECEIIDYQYPNVYQFERGYYHEPVWKLIIKSNLWWLRSNWRKHNKHKYRFKQFYKDFFKLSSFFDSPQSIHSAPPSYDIYLTGSDQVWNTKYSKGDTTFLLDFVTRKKKIAYAASFASDKLEDRFVGSFKPLLQQYGAISVRETGGQKIIKELLGKDVPVVSDPTLLLDADEWGKLLSGSRSKHPYGNKKYILAYVLGYAFNPSPAVYDVLQKLQEQTSYDIVSIGWLDERKVGKFKTEWEVGPLEFLQLFKHASCVVTSSFHGTAFAVNFGKPVFPVVPPVSSQDDRQITLLESLGMGQAAIRADMHVDTLDMDRFAEISRKGNVYLQEQRKDSIACLARMLADASVESNRV